MKFPKPPPKLFDTANKERAVGLSCWLYQLEQN